MADASVPPPGPGPPHSPSPAFSLSSFFSSLSNLGLPFSPAKRKSTKADGPQLAFDPHRKRNTALLAGTRGCPPAVSWVKKLDSRPEALKEFSVTFAEAMKNLPLGYRLWNHNQREKAEGRIPVIDPFFKESQPWACHGVPLGGIGACSIGRGFRGDFNRWTFIPGKCDTNSIGANQFSAFVRRKSGGRVQKHSTVLFPGRHKDAKSTKDGDTGLSSWGWNLDGLRATYFGLMPRAWTLYEGQPDPELTISCRQVSPFIPNNYQESSLPCAVFIFTLVNNGKEPADASILFTFANSIGHQSGNTGDHSNYCFSEDNGIHGVLLNHQCPKLGGPCTLAVAGKEGDGVSVTTCRHFSISGKGPPDIKTAAEVWQQMEEKGALDPPGPGSGRPSTARSAPSSSGPSIAAGVCGQVTVPPGGTKEVSFCLAWDVPIAKFGRSSSYYRRYTQYYGPNGRAAPAIARDALVGYHRWEDALDAWQLPILKNPDFPDWYKVALFNELYFLVAGGSVWTDGGARLEERDLQHWFRPASPVDTLGRSVGLAPRAPVRAAQSSDANEPLGQRPMPVPNRTGQVLENGGSANASDVAQAGPASEVLGPVPSSDGADEASVAAARTQSEGPMGGGRKVPGAREHRGVQALRPLPEASSIAGCQPGGVPRNGEAQALDDWEAGRLEEIESQPRRMVHAASSSLLPDGGRATQPGAGAAGTGANGDSVGGEEEDDVLPALARAHRAMSETFAQEAEWTPARRERGRESPGGAMASPWSMGKKKNAGLRPKAASEKVRGRADPEVPGPSSWATCAGIKLLHPDEENVGQFLYLEGLEYIMWNTYDVHFYASFALLALFPKLELSVQRDFAASTLLQQEWPIKFLADGHGGINKVAGSVPHDLGIHEPWTRPNAYNIHDTSRWKDLNSKFVLQVYRDVAATGNMSFAASVWPAVEAAIKYLEKFDRDKDGLIENDGFPDQTYDNWSVHGVSSYCGGLWLAALRAGAALAILLGHHSQGQHWALLCKKGLKSFEEKLWNGRYFNYDSEGGPNSLSIQADQLAGHWYLLASNLPGLVDNKKACKALQMIFEYNVMRVGRGYMGAVNGMTPDGMVDDSCIQSREVWTGVTYAVAATMLHEGMWFQGFRCAEGIFRAGWEKLGYWYQTPEGWDVEGRYRALSYMRPLAIWAMHWALTKQENFPHGTRLASISSDERTGSLFEPLEESLPSIA